MEAGESVAQDCKVCGEGCHSDAIKCSACSSWFHGRCQQLTPERLACLDDLNLDYTCRQCARSSGTFNSKESLQRLTLCSFSFDSLKAAVLCECILLRDAPYLAGVAEKVEMRPGMEKDLVATGLLASTGGMGHHTPVSTTANGNCLFNALSLAIKGDESLAAELRIRTCIEMVAFAEKYKAIHRLTELGLVSPSYDEACKSCARAGQYSSAWTIQAAASIIGGQIISIYPPVNGMLDMSVRILNTAFHPRVKHMKVCIYLMWTSTQTASEGITWTPNHFVPLLQNSQGRASCVKDVSASASLSQHSIKPDQASGVGSLSSPHPSIDVPSESVLSHHTSTSRPVPCVLYAAQETEVTSEPLSQFDTPSNLLSGHQVKVTSVPPQLVHAPEASPSQRISIGELETSMHAIFSSGLTIGMPAPHCQLDAPHQTNSPEASLMDLPAQRSADPTCTSGRARTYTLPMTPAKRATKRKRVRPHVRCVKQRVALPQHIPEGDEAQSLTYHRVPGNPLKDTFLSPQTLYKLACEETPQYKFKDIPVSKKDNVYFVIDNSANINNREAGIRTDYKDGCGVWDSRLSSTKCTYFYTVNGGMDMVRIKDGKFFKNSRRKLKEMDPQPKPEEVIILKRYYATLRRDPTYRRRITWFERMPGQDPVKMKTSIVEYLGIQPINSLNSSFLSPDTLYRIICSESPQCSEIPAGIKDNIYFVMDNSANIASREAGRRSDFSDDCGVWENELTSTKRTDYLMVNNTLLMVTVKDGKFCTGGARNLVELDPQPRKDDIIIMRRYYSSLKRDLGYRKRVTWFENMPNQGPAALKKAIVEYLGEFPLTASVHGNCKKNISEYVRSSRTVREGIRKNLREHSPKKVYTDMVNTDSLHSPRDLKQVQNMKYMYKFCRDIRQDFQKSPVRPRQRRSKSKPDPISEVEVAVANVCAEMRASQQ